MKVRLAHVTGLLLGFCLAVSPLIAEEKKEKKEAPKEAAEEVKGENDVYVGVYIDQIYDLSLRENRFVVDFWIWFRWKNDAYNPLETFEVIDSRSTSKEHEMKDPEKKNGFNYAQARVTATITKFFDVRNFPLDNHTLDIKIEDSKYEDKIIKFLPDTENSSVGADVRVNGWNLSKGRATAEPHVYETNYGDPTASKTSTYSRFKYSADLTRPGWGGFIKLYFALFISVVVALLQFRINPEEIIARLTLGVGAVIGVMTSQFVIVSTLPDTDQLNMADKFHMLGIFFIFITLAESVWVKHLSEHEHEHQAKGIDGMFFYGGLVVYVVVNALIVAF